MTIRDIAIAFGYEIDKESEKKANNSINSLKNNATRLLGFLGVGFSLTQINAIVEQFKMTNQQLKSVTGHLANQKELQDTIMSTASNIRLSYENTAKAVSSYVSQSKKVLKSSDEALNFVELTTKAWKAAGKEEATIASLHDTLAKAFQKNIIDAGTFETILSQSPETISYLEKSLGKTRTQLKAMADAGVLTASHLTTAFTKSADEINSKFAQTGITITEATRVAKDKIGLVLSQTDEGIKLTTTIAQLIVKGSDFAVKGIKAVSGVLTKLIGVLGGTENALKLIAVIMAAMFTVSQIAKLKNAIDVYRKMEQAQKLLNKQMLLSKLHVISVIAAIVMLFLIIEDIVGFINGKDSVFGDILKKAGFDVEDIRTKLKDFYDKLKTKVDEIVSFLKDNGESIVKGIMAVVVVLGMLNLIFQTIKTGIAIYNGVMAAKIAIDKLATLAMSKLGLAGLAASIGIASIIVIAALVIAALALLVAWVIKNWDKIKAWLDSMGEKISAWWDGVKKKASDKISEIKTSVGKGFQSIADWFKQNWKALLMLIIFPFAGALMLLYNNNEKFRNAVDNLLNKIREKFGELKQKLKDKVSEWKTGIEEGFEGVKAWFEGLPGRAFKWGKDMLQNFIDGIKGEKGKLDNAVGDIATEIDDNLGHSVPKRGPLKDDDKWMPDFMQNLYVGLRKGLPQLRQSIGEIVSELAVFANPEPSTVTQNISQGATSQRIINQYNSWTNHFNGGSKQEQSDLARASEKQTTQASNKLGRELAYTR